MILRTKQGWLGDWKTRVGGVVAKKTHPIDFIEQCGDKLHSHHTAPGGVWHGSRVRRRSAHSQRSPRGAVYRRHGLLPRAQHTLLPQTVRKKRGSNVKNRPFSCHTRHEEPRSVLRTSPQSS